MHTLFVFLALLLYGALSLNVTIFEKVFENVTEKNIENIPKIIKRQNEKVPEKVLKTKNPVPLTMRQGLVLNQILSIYSLDKFETEMCKKHTEEFRKDLRSLEPWALKMFDSSSKLQAGIMMGNLMEFGDFSQCIEIDHYSESGRILGKHCLIRMIPSIDIIRSLLQFRNISSKRFAKVKYIVETSEFKWSVCVPASCNVNEVYQHFNKNIIELAHGLDVKVELNQKHCVTKADLPQMGTTQYFVIAFLSIFVVISFIAGIVDYYNTPKMKKSFINSFSVVANYKRIVAEGKQSDLNCIHGIRFISTVYVVVGHRFLMTLFFPVQNSLELLNWILYYSSTPILGGTVCVDSFFFISGMLTSYGFFDHVNKTKTFQIIPFYLHRYLRITLPLIVVLIIQITLLQFLGSGPLYYDTYTSQQSSCIQYWWAFLLHIQDYTNSYPICLLPTWYLSCDMLYYYISPLMLYPLWKYPVFGYINYVFFYVLSVGLSFYVSWIHKFPGGMPITSQQQKTVYFRKHYVAPHTRASPYIIGLGLGYAIFQMRDKKVKIGVLTQIAGWITTIVSMGAVIVGSHSFVTEDHEFNQLEASIFLSCSRSAWTFGLAWMVWCCIHGYGGIVNYILSWQIFRVLGRIAYAIFLLHINFQFLKSGAAKAPVHFSNFELFYESLADLGMAILVSFLFTIFIELPLVKVAELPFKGKEANPKRVEPKK